MAVQYVKDFTFAPSPPRPTVRGYARGGLVKGHGVSNDSGHTGNNGADRFSKRAQGDGPVAYHAKGGLAVGKGVTNDAGHSGGKGPDNTARSGAGDGDLKRTKVSPDIKKSVGEKTSGVQKPAFKSGGGIKLSGKFDGKSNAVGQGGRAAQLKAKGVPGGVIGNLARKAQAAPGQKNYHAKGGRARMADGGSVGVAAGKIPNKGRNPDDSVSPGSFKRTPMSQGDSNMKAANSKFSAEGRNTPVATKQDGDVQRMSGYSDFKSGGSTKPAFNRLKNLGHYAHGGKVKGSTGERSAGTAGSGAVKAPVKATNAGKAERAAGTPKTSPGSRVEMKAGTAKAAMGGLSRGTSSKKNAAIHAKGKKSHAPKSAGLGALAGALSGMGMPSQGAGAGPGMAPGMGAPPGGPMGGMAPQAPTMGGGPPAMASGGQLKSFTHVAYK